MELAPYKDRLFAYPAVIERRDGGSFIAVDYREMRDINRRDQVPERRVKRRYVDLKPRRLQSDGVLETAFGSIEYVLVGRLDGARVVTAYVHGRGGNRRQGVNDFTFGGNFNRIKNLMARNAGLYVTMNAGELDDAAVRRVRALLAAILARAPRAKLVLACASAGGTVCHRLSDDSEIVERMAGMAFLGSYGTDGMLSSDFRRARVPLFIAHGSADTIIPVGSMDALYRQFRSTSGYPVRMVRFETGGHGTPIRMTDWRDMINWMLREGA